VEGFLGMQAASVSVVTPGSGPACGYEFKRGERYLVYATRAADGTGLVTGLCSRTKPLADAAEDLRFIQTLSGPSPGRARVYGTITHWERDLATGEGHEYGPVADVIVSVRNVATSFDAATDARGRYEVAVPPGKYEVTAMPPPAFSSRYLQRTVELRDARACFVADFGVRFDGRIRGVVRHPSGEPAEGVYVQAMAAEAFGKPGNIETRGLLSDAGGAFEFSEVPPAQYVVGVELTRASYWDEVQRNPLSGTFGPFVVTGDTGPLRIVLSARR
jgi:hypothetical protein